MLGLQGKFDEARQVASLDMSDQEAKSNMAYLRNMLSNPNQFAAAAPNAPEGGAGDDWQPFGAADAKGAAPVKSAVATPTPAPKMQVVKAAKEIVAPSAVVKSGKASRVPSPAKPSRVAGSPTLVTQVNATPAQVQGATPTASAAKGGPASLLRSDVD